MLLDFAAFKQDCLGLVPENHQERFASIMADIDVAIGGFIRGRLVVCFIIGLLVTISLLVLRVPFAILLGIASGFLNLIPYLGPALSLAPAVALTSLEFLDTGPDHTAQWVCIKLCLVVGSFTIIQILDGFIISPKIMAQSVNVSPLVVLGVLMLGGAIAGITGMVLAVPVYCVLKVLVGEYRKDLARQKGYPGTG
jgi:predicted PurR-regulated permease PerM